MVCELWGFNYMLCLGNAGGIGVFGLLTAFGGCSFFVLLIPKTCVLCGWISYGLDVPSIYNQNSASRAGVSIYLHSFLISLTSLPLIGKF